MHKQLHIVLCFLTAMLIQFHGYAQTFIAGQQITISNPDYLLIATNNAPVSMSLGSLVAGDPVTSGINSALYVKISSRCPSGKTRTLSAKIVSGVVPDGTVLTVVSSACTLANSGGAKGTIWPFQVNLTNTNDFPLVFNIGTCWTGTGYNDGYKMTFRWKLRDAESYSLIGSGTYNVTVVFTLSEYN